MCKKKKTSVMMQAARVKQKSLSKNKIWMNVDTGEGKIGRGAISTGVADLIPGRRWRDCAFSSILPGTARASPPLFDAKAKPHKK